MARAFDCPRFGWRLALPGAAASALVVPVQQLRGWTWGGTLEAGAVDVTADGLLTVVAGLAHSALTFAKTAFWLGGWSGVRPPGWLLFTVVVMALAACGLALRLRQNPGRPLAHALAATVMAAGFVVFAVGKRNVFGVWGAVGGWYFWGWAPWAALAAHDFLEPRPGRLPLLLGLGGLALALVNGVWLVTAASSYGL